MEGDASAGHPGQHQPLSGHKHLTIITMMMMLIMMMVMGRLRMVKNINFFHDSKNFFLTY